MARMQHGSRETPFTREPHDILFNRGFTGTVSICGVSRMPFCHWYLQIVFVYPYRADADIVGHLVGYTLREGGGLFRFITDKVANNIRLHVRNESAKLSF